MNVSNNNHDRLMARAKMLSEQFNAANKADPEGEEGFNLVPHISRLMVQIAEERGIDLNSPDLLAIGMTYFDMQERHMGKCLLSLAMITDAPNLKLVH